MRSSAEVGTQGASDWVLDETVPIPAAMRTATFRFSFLIEAEIPDDVVGLDDVRVVAP